VERKAIDAGEFRAAQKQQWGVASAGWRKHSESIDESASIVSERLVALAEIGPGDRVLDVAAGYGEPSLTAASKVGAEGSVVATDISAEMLAYGRERASAARVENIEFVESDAISLDFPVESFDAAVSRWGIIFDPDGEGAARKVHSLLKPGGKFAISSWAEPDRVPFLAIPMRTVMNRLQVPPPPPGTPGPLSRPTAEAISGLLEGGGFSDVTVEEAEVGFDYESPEAFTTFVREIAPPVTAMMTGHPPEVQEETWDAITEAVREHAGGGGPVSFTSVALLAVGKA
jgi:enediyne biosynthesis protein CalE5